MALTSNACQKNLKEEIPKKKFISKEKLANKIKNLLVKINNIDSDNEYDECDNFSKKSKYKKIKNRYILHDNINIIFNNEIDECQAIDLNALEKLSCQIKKILK